MKERPILFSAPMVRALLDGTKTQTRRVVKPRPDWAMGKRCMLQPHELAGEVNQGEYSNCPYGQPGDRLWVRETWCGEIDGHTSQLIYNEDGNTYKCLYRADGHHVVLDDGDGFTKTNKDGSEASPWKPSIHMPRWASRITLEITAVRVERLQDISKADAQAEGIVPDGDGGWHLADTRHYMDDPISSYASLWEYINGPGSWDLNPWVWVIEFKKVPV
jgi:hypothetical protein